MSRSPTKMSLALMALLRDQTMTREQILKHLDWCDKAVARWTRDFADAGVLLVVDMPRRPGDGGYAPKGYRLSPAWGGVAA